MNLLEQQLHYPLGDQLPAPGESLELAPGVRWIRMALPFVLDHINLWLLRDEVDGRPGATTGVFGNNVGGANEIVIESQDGNVQVGVLPSPI